jgi:hypothetical protein
VLAKLIIRQGSSGFAASHTWKITGCKLHFAVIQCRNILASPRCPALCSWTACFVFVWRRRSGNQKARA